MIQKSSLALLTIIAVMLCTVTATGWASTEGKVSDWRFSKAIEIKQNEQKIQGKETTKYRSLFLDEAVYTAVREDLGDLRIVDAEGQFVPFYLENGHTENTNKDTVYQAQMVTSFQKNKDTLIDFLITPLQLDTDIQGNVLRIGLPSQPFLKFVEVSGSYDGNQWQLLGKYNLYNTEQLEKDTIELGQLYKYTHYRLRIIDNVEKIAFTELELVHNEQASSLAAYTKTFTPTYKVIEEGKRSLLTIENEQRLRVKKISLVVESNFRRNFELLDSAGANISLVGRGELYNLNFKDIQINNTAIILAAPNRAQQIMLKIDNDDNAPLRIKQVNIEYDIHRLVFEDSGSQSYHLLYGALAAAKPKYEIEDFKDHIEKENPLLATLGSQVERVTAIESTPSWFQTKMAFNLILGLVSLLLIGFLVQKLKRVKG